MLRAIHVATSLAASVARLGSGARVGPTGARPARLLELYDFEACPSCRKVREALSRLDLDAVVYPCPQGGTRYRPRAAALGGKVLFPYLIDPNTGRAMYESDDIVAYLYREYGDGRVPLALALGPVTMFSSALASAFRPLHGGRRLPARAPEQPLELWSFEASPFSRLVREMLTSLELSYVLHNVAKGSRGRDALVKRAGKMMVPYLADPNTGTEMFESAEIVAYLHCTYAEE